MNAFEIQTCPTKDQRKTFDDSETNKKQQCQSKNDQETTQFYFENLKIRQTIMSKFQFYRTIWSNLDTDVNE